MAIHQPKVGMCANCKNALKDCSGLDFKRMPTISRKPASDGVVIVKCIEFERVKK